VSVAAVAVNSGGDCAYGCEGFIYGGGGFADGGGGFADGGSGFADGGSGFADGGGGFGQSYASGGNYAGWLIKANFWRIHIFLWKIVDGLINELQTRERCLSHQMDF
jgi:hypothetical protein